jgi:hypothetical protein
MVIAELFDPTELSVLLFDSLFVSQALNTIVEW